MKTASFLVLSAAAGVALAFASHAEFLTHFRADYFVGAVTIGGVAAIMSADYGRRPRVLTPRAVRTSTASPAITAIAPRRSSAYGVRRRASALVEHAV